jgi:hypothetical protein
MQRPREWNRLPYVIQPADPRYRPFNPHAEPRVWHAAVTPQIKVPLEGFPGELVFINPAA